MAVEKSAFSLPAPALRDQQRQQLRGISTKMLTQALKLLVDYGMVTRTAYPEVPPRVAYALTEFGRSSAGPLLALFEWSVAWQPTLTRLYDERHPGGQPN